MTSCSRGVDEARGQCQDCSSIAKRCQVPMGHRSWMFAFLSGTGGALFFATAVHASLVDYGHYTHDPTTGLDWLDVTQTTGLSFDAVKAGVGGWLGAGWRLAFRHEVSDLATRYIGTSEQEAFYSGATYPAALHNATALVRLLGVTLSFNNDEGSQQFHDHDLPVQIDTVGYFEDETNNGTSGLGELMARLSAPAPYGEQSFGSRWYAYPDLWVAPGTGSAGVGSFLVRQGQARIPEPTTLALAMMACAGATLLRRSRPRPSVRLSKRSPEGAGRGSPPASIPARPPGELCPPGAQVPTGTAVAPGGSQATRRADRVTFRVTPTGTRGENEHSCGFPATV